MPFSTIITENMLLQQYLKKRLNASVGLAEYLLEN
jgi:hypothetical protein